MRRRLRLKTAILLIAALGLMFPPQSQAEYPYAPAVARPAVTERLPSTTPAPPIADVALDADGRLQGQVVDNAGLPAAGTTIVLVSQGRAVAVVTSDAAGHFTAEHLAGGIYEVHAAGNVSLARLWAPQTAPPAARQTLVVQCGDPSEPIVRGQHTFGPFDGSWMKGRGPWLIAAAAIVAVPTALALGLKPRSPAS
jgi:hypothetical protein